MRPVSPPPGPRCVVLSWRFPEDKVSAGIGIATGFLTSAAAGILWALLFAPFKDLGRFFFALNAGLAFGLLCLATPYRMRETGDPSGGPIEGAFVSTSAAVLAIAVLIVYLAALYIRGPSERKGLLALAATVSLIATAAEGWRTVGGAKARWLFAVNGLAAAALLGFVIVAMILGHWYLVKWRLPVAHLVRFSLMMAVAVGARAALLVTGMLVAGAKSPLGIAGFLEAVAVDRAFFFWQRVFFGLLGPAVFAYMVHETARIRSTQSATGLLYIAVIFVVIGELLARYLAVSGGGPM